MPTHAREEEDEDDEEDDEEEDEDDFVKQLRELAASKATQVTRDTLRVTVFSVIIH